MTKSIAIVTDECVDYAITATLRNAGFEVYAISEQNPAIKDKDVLDIASGEGYGTQDAEAIDRCFEG